MQPLRWAGIFEVIWFSQPGLAHDTQHHSRHRRTRARKHGQQHITPHPEHNELHQPSHQPRAEPILQSPQCPSQPHFPSQPTYNTAYAQQQGSSGQFAYAASAQQGIAPLRMYQPPVSPISPSQHAESTARISLRDSPSTPTCVNFAARKIIKNLPKKDAV